MPFTLSHPVAVVPLRRWGLVLSAMVVGSMAPDFEYFFGLTRPRSHAMPGIVIFTFPLALAVLVIFHELVKWPLISLLPRSVQARVVGPARRFRWWPASRFGLILVSLAVGIATHILWDGFTHLDGWAVTHAAPLREQVTMFGHYRIRLSGLLQLGCTVLGTAALAICIVAWYLRATRDDTVLRPQFSPALKWSILCAMTATALAVGLANGAAWYGPLLHSSPPRERFVLGFAMTTTVVGCIELFGFGLICRAFRSVLRERASASGDD